MLLGTRPPTSVAWIMSMAKQTRRPWWKIGFFEITPMPENRPTGMGHNPCNGLEEEYQVSSFGEAGDLRRVVQAHVHHTAYSRILEPGEEFLGGFLREANGEDLHASTDILL